MSWKRTGNEGLDAAVQGHKVIMTPNKFFYFDRYPREEDKNKFFGYN